MFNKKFKSQKGVIAIFTVILVLIILLIILTGLQFLTSYQQRISRNRVQSMQAYYIAESGIEDALLRLKADWELLPTSDDLIITPCTAHVIISDKLGGARTVTSEGNCSGIIRKIQVVYMITSDSISFRYGAQADDGGIDMGNNARIYGNIYSNGDVENRNPGNWGYVYGGVIAAEDSMIKNLKIGETIKNPEGDPGSLMGSAYAYSCVNSQILYGELTYVDPAVPPKTDCSGQNCDGCCTGIPPNCLTTENITTQTTQFSREELPISEEQITRWKNGAIEYNENDFAGCPYPGCCMTIDVNDVIIDGCENCDPEDLDCPFYLGPVTIGKNLIVKNGNYVRVAGTIYVTGNITFQQNSQVSLDSNYGELSGIIIADGKISAENVSFLGGSGLVGSYILVLSTYPINPLDIDDNPSNDVNDYAIDVRNRTKGAIFYTNNGSIHLNNKMTAKEVTAYRIIMDNNAEIIYESGLEDSRFTSGPGGGWAVVSWEEI